MSFKRIFSLSNNNKQRKGRTVVELGCGREKFTLPLSDIYDGGLIREILSIYDSLSKKKTAFGGRIKVTNEMVADEVGRLIHVKLYPGDVRPVLERHRHVSLS